MVKKKTARQKVREKSTKNETSTKGDGDPMVQDGTASQWDGGEEGGSKSVVRASVKRKMDKQLRFLSKLQETQRVLSAKKTISKKRRRSQSGKTLNDLSSLAEFLPALGTPTTAAPPTKILRSKAKQKIVVNETKQLAAVLAHPQFQSNPFAAIQQHLIATLPPTPAPLSKPAPKAGQKKRPNSKKA